MHFSKSNTTCYTNLKADESDMKKATECSYLGDILSTSGTMDKTIESTTNNAEVWYPISDSQIGILENVDLMLIRKLVNGHSKTAKEAFFLESGLLPIKFICMKRRLMYLHTVLTRSESEITRRFYEVQKSIHTKNN